MALGVTAFIPNRCATFPRVGALLCFERFDGLGASSMMSLSDSIFCAEVGEVNKNLNVYKSPKRKLMKTLSIVIELTLIRIALLNMPFSTFSISPDALG